MQFISSDQVTPAIIALFDTSRPTIYRAFNVLDGNTAGQILVDDPIHPHWAIVRVASYGTLYLAGAVTAAILATVVEYFRQTNAVGISFWPDDPINKILPPYPDYDGAVLLFTHRSAMPLFPRIPPELPATIKLVQRDATLFRQSVDYVSTLAAFGSVERVVYLTLGVVLIHNDSVLCEAATGAANRGSIEIGVTTAERFRNRGYATLTCAKLIDLCEQRGYQTWWDCAKHNQASVHLARKLGYHSEQEYRYIEWAKR